MLNYQVFGLLFCYLPQGAIDQISLLWWILSEWFEVQEIIPCCQPESARCPGWHNHAAACTLHVSLILLILLDLTEPARNVFESVRLGDVIHEHCSESTSVICIRNGTISLLRERKRKCVKQNVSVETNLPGSVPNLCFDFFPIVHGNKPCGKLHPWQMRCFISKQQNMHNQWCSFHQL
jgi:hypothetical protein